MHEPHKMINHMPHKANRIWYRIFLLVVVVVSAEYIVMLLFHSTGLETELSQEAWAIADAICLIIISALPTYFWIIKPIIHETQSAQDKLINVISALDGSAGAVLITDENGSIKYVNQVFTEVTGYTAEDVIGQNPRILQSGKQSPEFYATMWQSINRTGEWSGLLTNKRKDGRIYPERLHIREIRDANGNIKSYIGNITDITEQQQQEKLVIQAQKMEAVGSLVGGVAHNFNNVLAVITGNTYLARKRTDDPILASFLKGIDTAAKDASDMVKQLLSFSQNSIQQKQETKIKTLLQEVMNTAQLGISEDIQVTTDFADDALVTHCDTVEIKQVLINIINNARDAVEGCPEKRINVTSRRMSCDTCSYAKRCEAFTSDVIHITIEDTGKGISEDNLENIFDPFFTTKEVNKGTGLGLSMAKGTIQSHGGTIHVTSTEGVGTAFEICLPITKSSVVPKKTKYSAINSTGNETILIIDDEHMVLTTLQQLLLALGYNVITANSGKEGIQAFKEHADTIHLVISDVIMPEMDGPTAIAEILKEKPEQPYMFITGYDNNQLGHLEESSIIAQKPFNVGELSNQIQQLINPED